MQGLVVHGPRAVVGIEVDRIVEFLLEDSVDVPAVFGSGLVFHLDPAQDIVIGGQRIDRDRDAALIPHGDIAAVDLGAQALEDLLVAREGEDDPVLAAAVGIGGAVAALERADRSVRRVDRGAEVRDHQILALAASAEICIVDRADVGAALLGRGADLIREDQIAARVERAHDRAHDRVGKVIVILGHHRAVLDALGRFLQIGHDRENDGGRAAAVARGLPGVAPHSLEFGNAVVVRVERADGRDRIAGRENVAGLGLPALEQVSVDREVLVEVLRGLIGPGCEIAQLVALGAHQAGDGVAVDDRGHAAVQRGLAEGRSLLDRVDHGDVIGQARALEDVRPDDAGAEEGRGAGDRVGLLAAGADERQRRDVLEGLVADRGDLGGVGKANGRKRGGLDEGGGRDGLHGIRGPVHGDARRNGVVRDARIGRAVAQARAAVGEQVVDHAGFVHIELAAECVERYQSTVRGAGGERDNVAGLAVALEVDISGVLRDIEEFFWQLLDA